LKADSALSGDKMAEKTKNCPQCGTSMDFRLGVYECPQCGHEEEDKAQPEATAAATSGPGFRKEAWRRPESASQPGQVPPPQSIGTIYTPGAAPPPGLYSEPSRSREPNSSLHTEKVVYFSLQAIGFVLLYILVAFALTMLGPVPDVDFNLGLGIFFSIITNLIYMGLLWFVLFGDQVWAKYCCGGCVLLSLLISVPGMFVSAPTGYNAPGMGVFQIVYILLLIAFNLWFLSILYRDVQQLKGY
jgi:hypothetical protein